MICPKCHSEVQDGSTFCTACGEKLEQATSALGNMPEEGTTEELCSCCGSPLRAGMEFCTVCGTARSSAGETTVIPAGDDATRVISDPMTMFEFHPGSEVAPDDAPVFDPGRTQVDEAFAVGVDRRAAEGALWSGEVELKPLPEPQHYAPASNEHFDSLAPDASTPVMNSAASARVEHEQARSRRNNKRTAVAVAVIVAVVALACGGVFAFSRWQAAEQAKAEAEQAAEDERIAQAEHAVTIKVTCGGWDTAAGASRLPVQVKGTDVSSTAVDEVQFVDSEGKGLSLRQGEYALTVPASPISVDGTVYSVSNTTVEVSFTSKDENKEIDATGNGGFELSPVEAAEVTDEQIASAYEYAQKDTGDGAPSADALKAIAVKRRDDAVAAAAKAARTITTAHYTVTVPESWSGQVTYSIDGNGTLYIWSSKYPDYDLCWISLKTSPAPDAGDISRSLVKEVSLGGGYYADVFYTRWAYNFACAAVDEQGYYDSVDYSYDKAKELVNLQCGGAVSLDEAISAAKSDDADTLGQLALKGDDFIVQNIASTIEATS